MRIRAITYFFSPDPELSPRSIHQAGIFSKRAQAAFEAGGYEVQTTRLATSPFPHWLPEVNEKALLQAAQAFEAAAAEQGIDYLSFGPALPDYPPTYRLIPPVLAETSSIFFSGVLTTPHGGISLPAVQASGEIIQTVAGFDANGFANLRFAALANVPPGAPFFPAAYHAGGSPVFSLACEAADLAVEAFSQADTLAAARRSLVASLEQHAGALTEIAIRLQNETHIPFGGLDLTPAPFPDLEHSLGTALERLGVPNLGQPGSLAAAAILAATLDQATFARCGFNGLMLPVLEDALLARRAAEGSLSLKDLLLFSSVCGTGLDTVPLPGDATAQQLAAVLLDVAALAQRLNKPLTARLMPIQGKKAGDPTNFDFAYFANSRVLALDAAPLTGFLAGEENFDLQPRQSQV
ncbi:MAG TPA: DUF711 family protein [Anaerolineales bacterium]|nr:DUF711 family protein [Anaerolineales bacterium]